MFGYLQIDKDELKVKDYRLYKSVYCGLCRQMGKDYGIAARLTLSYDCTALALLYMSLNSEKCRVIHKRCVVNPLKKCEFCNCEGKALEFAGAVSVIMSYNKLEDDINDSKALKKLTARIMKLVFKRNYKEAAGKYPEIAAITEQMLKKQTAAESEQADIDRAAEPTAALISRLCAMLCPEGSYTHTAEVFGYYLGRWIYLMDAADDLEKDIREDEFNPFREKYNGDTVEIMTYCNEVLNMTAAQIAMAYDLLGIAAYKSVLDNIIYDGLAKKQYACLFDKYDQRGRKKHKREKS